MDELIDRAYAQMEAEPFNTEFLVSDAEALTLARDVNNHMLSPSREMYLQEVLDAIRAGEYKLCGLTVKLEEPAQPAPWLMPWDYTLPPDFARSGKRNFGEVSPRLQGRVDLAAYRGALSNARCFKGFASLYGDVPPSREPTSKWRKAAGYIVMFIGGVILAQVVQLILSQGAW